MEKFTRHLPLCHNEPGNLESLILNCQLKNPMAQEYLYLKFSGRVMHICRKYCGNKSDAEDAFQEVFIKIFQKIEMYSFKGSFEGWITRIAVNTALKSINRRSRYALLSDFTENETTSTTLNTFETEGKELIELIATLPRGSRTVFNLYYQGFTHKEIGDLLDVTEGTSKSQLFAARKELRKLCA